MPSSRASSRPRRKVEDKMPSPQKQPFSSSLHRMLLVPSLLPSFPGVTEGWPGFPGNWNIPPWNMVGVLMARKASKTPEP